MEKEKGKEGGGDEGCCHFKLSRPAPGHFFRGLEIELFARPALFTFLFLIKFSTFSFSTSRFKAYQLSLSLTLSLLQVEEFLPHISVYREQEFHPRMRMDGGWDN